MTNRSARWRTVTQLREPDVPRAVDWVVRIVGDVGSLKRGEGSRGWRIYAGEQWRTFEDDVAVGFLHLAPVFLDGGDGVRAFIRRQENAALCVELEFHSTTDEAERWFRSLADSSGMVASAALSDINLYGIHAELVLGLGNISRARGAAWTSLPWVCGEGSTTPGVSNRIGWQNVLSCDVARTCGFVSALNAGRIPGEVIQTGGGYLWKLSTENIDIHSAQDMALLRSAYLALPCLVADSRPHRS